MSKVKGHSPYTRKANLPKTKKTLADVVKPRLKAQAKQAAAQKAQAQANQSVLSDLLGGVKRQSDLAAISTDVSAFGTSAQRSEFERLNGIFRKEGQALLDDYLGNVKNRSELESLRGMVELNGSAAQKARFAEWESYFQRPTFQKYANLHGTTYTPPTSGVAEADRRAAQIIAKNEQHNELQKVYDKLFNQKAEGQLAEAERLKDIGLGTAKPTASSGMTWQKYAEAHGTTYTPPTSGVAEADRRAAQIIAGNEVKDRIRQQLSGGSDYRAASEALINKPASVAQRIDDLEAAFGAKVEHVKQVKSYTDAGTVIGGTGTGTVIGGTGTGTVIGGTGAGTVIGGGAGSSVVAEGSSWMSKLKTAGKWALGIAVVAGLGYLAYKGISALINKNKKADEGEAVQEAQQAQKAQQKQPDEQAKKAQQEQAVTIPEEVKENQIPAEAVADSIKNNAPIDADKFYVAQKGDCVWNIVKNDYLPKHQEIKDAVTQELTEKYGRVPTEDEVIAEVTKRICHQNNINYFHAQPKPLVGDTVRFDKAA